MPPGKAGKRENCISYSNAVLVHCLNSTSCLISSMFWLTTPVLTLLYDSLNLVINALSSGLLGGMVQDKRSRQRCRSWTMFHAQYTSALTSMFPLSQGNAEALDSWGWKTKHRLISYFLSNSSAKNYQNWIVYVKIVASQRWDVFWDTVYLYTLDYRTSCSWTVVERQFVSCADQTVIVACKIKLSTVLLTVYTVQYKQRRC